MQEPKHSTGREGEAGGVARRVSPLPPVKDPQLQAWLSPLAAAKSDGSRAAPIVSRIQSGDWLLAGNTLRGIGLSAVAALAVGVLTWTMLPQSEIPSPALLSDTAAQLEASIVPAAGGGETVVLSDAASIEEIERLLQAIAFEPGKIDGYLDSATENAIRAFEKAAGREPTGQPTVGLLAELRAVSQDLAGN